MTPAMADMPLFRRAPALAARVPHLPIGTFPTPVEGVELDDDGAVVPILVKRDDIGAPGYAGNKVRKLEFILADARASGAERLITAGAAGSHHAFATAYHGRNAGFDVSLVLFPQSITPHVREMLLLDAAVGAELVWASRMETVPYNLWRARFAHRRIPSCTVPPGGSSEVGTYGYVNAGLELAEQIQRDAVPMPSAIHVAAGTLGTVAGIAIGLAWAGMRIPVIATRITARVLTNEVMLGALVRSTVARIRAADVADVPDAADALDLVEMRHDQIGAGYGKATQAGAHATAVFRAAGLELDATYTAKAAASLLADARATDGGRAAPGRPLFWHTLSAIAPRELLHGVHAEDLPPPFARYLAGS